MRNNLEPPPLEHVQVTCDPEDKPYCYFQLDAYDRLQAEFLRRGKFINALLVYSALCIVGGGTESEPGPDRDGKPFTVRLAELRKGFNTIKDTRELLADFVRIGLIDPVDIPRDPLVPFAIRMRQLDGKGGE